ncbi:hypothetical protein PG988_016402, partial [Apiospora saccharicola]
PLLCSPTHPQTSSNGVKYALVAIFVACSGFGGWAALGSMEKTGLTALIETVLAGDRAALPGGPEPFKRHWLGLAPVDGLLNFLVAFFSAMVDGVNNTDSQGKVEWNGYLFYVWGMSQFVAAWAVLLLESLRVGNRGRLVSYIGFAGLLFQIGTWTVVGPLYLALHLLTSPVASARARGDGPKARRALFVLLWDMALIPAVVTLTDTLPAVLMNAAGASASAHYKAIAFWQFFPLWTVLLQAFLHPMCSFLFGSLLPVDGAVRPDRVRRRPRALVAVSLAPAAVRTWLAVHATSPLLNLPASYASLFETASFTEIFIPASPFHPPTIVATSAVDGTVSYSGLAQAGAHFLRYDMFVGAVPFLLWAVYLHQTTVKTPLSPLALIQKIGFWFLVGGAYAPAVALLWDRDAVVLEGDEPLQVGAAVRDLTAGRSSKKAQ